MEGAHCSVESAHSLQRLLRQSTEKEHTGERFDVEEAFLKFVEARCRSRGAPPELRRRILRDLFGE